MKPQEHLPAGWKFYRFGDIAKFSRELFSVEPTETYKELSLRLYGNGFEIRREVSGSALVADEMQRMKTGQLVTSIHQFRNGAVGIVSPELEGTILSKNFLVYDLDATVVHAPFLHRFLTAPSSVFFFQANSTGSATPIFPKAMIEEVEIPLPPLAEQRRVVARIEELAAQIHEARTLRHQAAEEAEAIVASETNALFTGDAMNGWQTKSLEEVADIRSGVTLGRRLTGRTIRLPYLRVANVQDAHLDLSEIKEVEVLESEADKWKLQRGDLLLTEGGDWDKLGRGTVWREEIPNCIHQNHIFRVRTKSDEFVPEFVAKLIGSPVGKSYFQEASKQTTNLASINQRQLKAFKVFQPPLAEQRRIVGELDALQAEVDALKRLQAETAAELAALLPALLDRAFKGEL